jgi:hypothetical protein
MKILDEIEIIENFPAVYIEAIDSIIIADLHLGYEIVAAEEGVFIPKTQLREEMRICKEIIKKKRAKTLIMVGDIKNRYERESTYYEFPDVRDMLIFLKRSFQRVILVKGNHDTFIFYITSRFGIELFDELLLDEFYFVHGHQELGLRQLKGKFLIMGHEHPVIAMWVETGAKEVVKSYIFGKTNYGKKLLVLPAFSTLSYGTEMNFVIKEELLSPILKAVDLDEFEAIGVDEDVGILKFGKLGKLRRI